MKNGMGMLVFVIAGAVFAQSTPEGLWRTIDDETGQAKSHVRIESRDGMLFGTVEEILNLEKKAERCDKCPGDRLGQRIEGLEIMRDMKPEGDEWAGGTILDPKKGKIYKAKMSLNETGEALMVRGYIGISLIGRSQVWERVK